MSELFLTSNEAAKYLGVSRSSLTNWVKKGVLVGGLTPGGHHRFKIADLDAFAEKRGMEVPGNKSDKELVRILVVEDDEGFREYVKDALEIYSGYELKEAVDGLKGAMLVGSWKPDLIILDIRMPNMNGVEFLQMIRNDSDVKDVKVIVASAHISPELREEIEDLGVEIILDKPVRLAKLVAVIEKTTSLVFR